MMPRRWLLGTLPLAILLAAGIADARPGGGHTSSGSFSSGRSSSGGGFSSSGHSSSSGGSHYSGGGSYYGGGGDLNGGIVDASPYPINPAGLTPDPGGFEAKMDLTSLATVPVSSMRRDQS